MKVTPYIKKAKKEHPEIQHVTGNLYEEKHGGRKCACAIGFALIGKIGLERVQEMDDQSNGNQKLYDKFKEIFNLDPGQVYAINDAYGEGDLESVLTHLESEGL